MSHKVKDQILDALKDFDDSFISNEIECPIEENDDGIFIKFEYVKWYAEMDQEIKIVENILKDNLDDCKFVLIGEDENDNESFGNFDKVVDLYIERSIE